MRCYEMQGVAVPAVDGSKFSVAKAYSILKHGFKHWLRITR